MLHKDLFFGKIHVFFLYFFNSQLTLARQQATTGQDGEKEEEGGNCKIEKVLFFYNENNKLNSDALKELEDYYKRR